MIDESIIRERAYALWEKDACPEDADLFYWFLARKQLETALKRSSVERAACEGRSLFVNKVAATADEIKLRFRSEIQLENDFPRLALTTISRCPLRADGKAQVERMAFESIGIPTSSPRDLQCDTKK